LKRPELEIVFNLWYVYDAEGTVHALRARPYVLPGSDEDKLAFLEAFASTDYLVARQFPLPGPFLGKGEASSPFLSVKAMAGPKALSLFEEGMEKLVGEFPPQTDLALPPDPLVNLTPLFLDEKGNLTPVIEKEKA
jgi:hypothetical protein